MNALIAPLKTLQWPGGGYLYKHVRQAKNEVEEYLLIPFTLKEKKNSIILIATGNNYLTVVSGKRVTWTHPALITRCEGWICDWRTAVQWESYKNMCVCVCKCYACFHTDVEYKSFFFKFYRLLCKTEKTNKRKWKVLNVSNHAFIFAMLLYWYHAHNTLQYQNLQSIWPG